MTSQQTGRVACVLSRPMLNQIGRTPSGRHQSQTSIPVHQGRAGADAQSSAFGVTQQFLALKREIRERAERLEQLEAACERTDTASHRRLIPRGWADA